MGHNKQLNYHKLRRHHREIGVPWTDSSFPPTDASIGLMKCRELGRIEWRRVGDLSDRPRLVVDGVGRHDVVQGQLGNCWFVAAASVLAGVSRLWDRVLPDIAEQDWDYEKPENYCGVFRFLFWRFGSWEEVLVDDLIPTHGGKPVFTHSRDKDEWWAALMEKAYAKLHGSYEALDGGNLSDALVDFTGGVSELILLESEAGEKLYEEEERRAGLFSRLVEEVAQHALVCCAVRAGRGQQEERTEHGLVKGHAYGVTAVRRVALGDSGLVGRIKGREKVNLVRLRNPWGEKEWTGAFSDGSGNRSRSGSGGEERRLYSPRHLNTLFSRSLEWRSISQKEKEKLGLVDEDEGEFWMPFEDFVLQFTDVSLTHLINTSLFSFSKTWRESKMTSSWSRTGGRAGGCLNHPATFLDNPQLRFDLSKNEEVIIQLSQMEDRAKVLASERTKLVIGFHVLEVESNRKHRLHSMMTQSDLRSGASDYIKSSHVFMRKSLRAGRYLVVPSTFQPGQDGKFLLRLFSESSSGLTSLQTDRPSPPCPLLCWGSPPVMVTRLTVVSAQSLLKQDILGGADPYVLIKCEGEKLRSESVKNSLDPEWNFSVILYRHKPATGIKIQIWNKNIMMDQFMGQRVITDTDNPFSEDVSRVEKALELYNKGSRQDEKMSGSIKIVIENHEDLMAL